MRGVGCWIRVPVRGSIGSGALLGDVCSGVVIGWRDGFIDHKPVNAQLTDRASEIVELDGLQT